MHDGWSVYDRFTRAFHQQCIRHLQRRCQELLETAVRGAVRLPRAVLALIDRAFALRRAWRGHRLSGDDLAERGLGLACELEQLASGTLHARTESPLGGPSFEPRDALVLVPDRSDDSSHEPLGRASDPSGGRQSQGLGRQPHLAGRRAQSILMSVIRTCRQRAVEPLEFLSTIRCRPQPQLITA